MIEVLESIGRSDIDRAVGKLSGLPLDKSVRSQFNQADPNINVHSLFMTDDIPDLISLNQAEKLAPDWANVGSLIDEVGKLNSRVLWQDLLERAQLRHPEINFGYLGFVVFVDLESVAEFVKMSSTRTYGLTNQILSLSSLLGSRTTQLFTRKTKTSLVYPTLRRITERFGTKADSFDIYMQRMQALFPSDASASDSSAFSILQNCGVFEVNKEGVSVFALDPGLTRSFYESFGNQLRNSDYRDYLQLRVSQFGSTN